MPPALDILDVTIRDGSYVVDFQFTAEDVLFLCQLLERLGFRYIEVGHGFGLGASKAKGESAAADWQYLSAAAQGLQQARFGAFFIPGIGTRQHLKTARQDFGMHFVRIGVDQGQSQEAMPFAEYAKELGYEVMINFMKSYALPATEIGRAAATFARIGADAAYIVDSAGGMLPEEVAAYTRALAESCSLRIGFHGHNNLDLAVANAVAAVGAGCTLIDCSIGGLGRSAGNTPTEMMIPVLTRLGYQLPYDLTGVLDALQRFVEPILCRRRFDPLSVLSGLSRIHSGNLSEIESVASRHQVPVRRLLEAYGRSMAGENTARTWDEVAAEISRQQKIEPGRDTADNVLLRVHGLGEDHNRIRNTFVAIDELFGAVGALARKSNLPIVLLVDVIHAEANEAFDMADLLYHDDSFIVLNAVFGSVAQFARFAIKHRGQVQIFVFDNAAPYSRRALRGSQRQWHRGENVIFMNRHACNYHYLASQIHTLAAANDIENILLVGGDLQELTRHLATERSGYRYLCVPPGFYATGELSLFELDVATGQPRPATASEDQPFDLVVLLAPLSSQELSRVFEKAGAHAVLLDCVGQGEATLAAHARGFRQCVRLDPKRALTGELLNLLADKPILPPAIGPLP